MKISELSYEQQCHFLWRLNKKTACGWVTAQHLCRGDLGDYDLVEAFQQFGSLTLHSAKIHARKVINFKEKKK